MKFLKKNWLKLVLAALTLVGAVMFIVLLAQYSSSHHNELAHPLLPEPVADSQNATSFLFAHIAGLTFFVLATVFIITKMFTKKKSKWVLCAVGLVCTVLMIVSISGAIQSEQSKLARNVMNGQHDAQITAATRAFFLSPLGPVHEINPGLVGLISGEPVSEWAGILIGAGLTGAQANGLVGGFNDAVSTQIREAKDAASYQFFSRVVTLIVQLIVFGLIPLAIGLKMIFQPCKGEINVTADSNI